MTGSRTAAALLIVGLAALVRLWDNGADPPLVYGNAHVSDEGYYTKNAKELVRTGRLTWRGDAHNHVWLAPLSSLAFVPAFALSRPSLESARSTAALAGVGAVLLGGLCLGSEGGALLAMALLALSPGLVVLGRTALAEGFVVAASLLFVLALTRDVAAGRLPWRSALAFALALLCKASAVVLLPAGGIALLLAGGRRRALELLALGLLVLAVWRLGYIEAVASARTMYDYELGVHLGGGGSSAMLLAGAGRLLGSLRTQHLALGFVRDPLLLGLALAAIAALASDLLRGRKLAAVDAVAATWWICAAAFHSAAPYQPPRYFVGLLAPSALLAARLLARPGRLRAWLWPLLALGTAAALRSAADLPLAALLPGAAFLAGLLVLARERPRLRAGLLLAIPVLTLGDWARQPRYTIREATALLAGESPRTVVGLFAATFTLPLEARAVVLWDDFNRREDPWTHFDVSHLLLGPSEERWLLDRYPLLERRLELRARLAPQDGTRGTLALYALGPAAVGGVEPGRTLAR